MCPDPEVKLDQCFQELVCYVLPVACGQWMAQASVVCLPPCRCSQKLRDNRLLVLHLRAGHVHSFTQRAIWQIHGSFAASYR